MFQFRDKIEQETPHQEEVRIAHHEAGHATVGLRLFPNNIRSASILGGTDVRPVEGGSVNCEFRIEDIQDFEAFELQEATSACAGLVGELAFCGYHSEFGSSRDIIGFYQTLHNCAVIAYHRATGLRSDVVGAYAVRDRAQSLIQRGEALAMKIITQEDQLFRAIAVALLSKRHLNQSDLLALHQRFAVAP